MIKAVICTHFGDPDQLQIDLIPLKRPADEEVVIEVVACSINFPDTLMIQDKYQFKPPLPFAPGGEVSGLVKSKGDKVKHLKIGDRVFALCGWGGLSEEVVVNAQKVFPMPAYMDFITAASVMYNYGTSYYALKDRGQLQQGDTLLVLGAAGGVGLAAVELGKLMGATVIAAASSDEKLEACKSKGADFTINYSKEDIKEKIKYYTEGKGVDVVYDPVGDQYTEQALRSIAYKGRYLVVGFAAGEIPKIALNLALLKCCSIVGVFWGQFAQKEAANNIKNLQFLAQYFAEGKLSPYIYKLYTLEESPQALWDMINRKVMGKAVVVVNQDALQKDKTVASPSIEITTDTIEGFTHAQGKKVFKDLAHLALNVGTHLGTSEWVTLDQAKINEFAQAT
ncbi:MAG TPA: zinc-binding dehydrogenase, partial [Saprospiraceae bacterium]|nr:zinc-binding dehydrogenase [Saprospiraceae bacterium]